jgi:hypothetical protein
VSAVFAHERRDWNMDAHNLADDMGGWWLAELPALRPLFSGGGMTGPPAAKLCF